MTLLEAIKNANIILNEYAKDLGVGMSFTGKNKMSGTGKSADSIAVGKAKNYKNDLYLTAYEQKLPNLAKLTQKLKNEESEHALTVLGPALEELNVLLKTRKKFKVDDDGSYILPMGDNIRLYNVGGTYMLKYVGPKTTNERKEKVTATSTTANYDKKLLSNYR